MSEALNNDPLKGKDIAKPDIGSGGAIALKESLTIGDAKELHRQLVDALKQGKDLRLDAGKVERVDAAILQLLLVLQREIASCEGSLIWKAASKSLKQSAETLGMKELIKFPR